MSAGIILKALFSMSQISKISPYLKEASASQ